MESKIKEMMPGGALVMGFRRSEWPPSFSASRTRQITALGGAAQQNLVSEKDGIFAGPDSDALGPSHRRDNVHFSGPGLQAFADLWMEALKVEKPRLAAAG